MPVVYLHIGSPKSGTTFLQNVLWRNRPVLAELGVLLPGGSFAAQQRAADDLRGLRQDPTDPGPAWAGAWDELVAEVIEERPERAVISHETLAAADEEQARRAIGSLGDAEVHVVYTMRDLAGLLPSEWQEYVKHYCRQDYATWLTEVIDGGPETESGAWFWRVHDAAEVLRRWSAGLPPGRVHVVTKPPRHAPRDLLWRRFAGLLGVDPGVVDLEEVRANPSLGVVETELLRRINHEVAPGTPLWLYTRTVSDELAQEVLPRRAEMRRVPLPEDRLGWAGTRADELIEALRSAGYDVVGDLAELRPGDFGPQDHRPVTESELLAAATDGILGLLDRIAELHAEVAAARAELAELREKPLPKAVAWHVSERHEAVMRARVAYWHLVERLRGEQPGAVPEEEPAGPTVWAR
ncbi:hypothetical protein DPM19_14795 [Actinomadura craniellae]|uniref:Sulfotransferase family protein n=1 Tax=Actinomadura craniellae TaxID=2231787 RepID=A0A365H562_9ACTN|nr:hypothetical protein [Actinomadura craniellae]RAY14244.1 hypothetical protein DPM19_14795 [Actinomadura craniellae]